MTIVDRALGQSIPSGAWDCTFYRATHDSPRSNNGGLDTGFATYWPGIQGIRGTYHYANPDAGPAVEQAKLFCDRVLSQGWRSKATSVQHPGGDLWALDMEGDVNLRGTALVAWIDAFMSYTRSKLGDRGFLYIGFPWYVTHVSHTDFRTLQRYRWWLPDYGPNDGHEHPISMAEPFPPVLHQFTSNPFDQSSIVNHTVWHDLFDPEVIVHQEFNPPLSIISETMFDHPDLGRCHVGLGPDGGTFCSPKNAYMGNVVGKPYFKGRKAARIVAVKGGYQIIDTAGEKYGPHF